jgi:hypothetical protein
MTKKPAGATQELPKNSSGRNAIICSSWHSAAGQAAPPVKQHSQQTPAKAVRELSGSSGSTLEPPAMLPNAAAGAKQLDRMTHSATAHRKDLLPAQGFEGASQQLGFYPEASGDAPKCSTIHTTVD